MCCVHSGMMNSCCLDSFFPPVKQKQQPPIHMDQAALHNLQCVAQLLQKKTNLNQPFYATRAHVQCIQTDMDHFPYKRFFRGQYDSSKPHIMEREAGFRTRNDNCYKLHTTLTTKRPDYCWEFSCNNIKPCSKNIGKCNHFVVAP